MKKLLLMLTVLCGTVSTWAQVTKFYKPGERLSTLNPGQKVIFYNTAFNGSEDRTGFLIDNAGWFALEKQKPAANPIFSEKVGVWTIETVTDNTSYFTVNVKGANGYVGINGKTNNSSAQNLFFRKWTESDSGKRAGVKSENAAGAVIENNAISADDKVWLITNEDQSTTWNGNPSTFATWATGHPYAIYSVVEATTEDLNTILTAAKTEAVTELNTLKQLSEIYTTSETAIAAVNAVELENDDLEAALNTINTLVINAKADANGKNVKLCNKSTDARGGKYLGYDKANNRAAAVADGGDAAIWTIKLNADGTFKLYNWVNDHYLGTPADPTPVVTDEASAPSFKFIPTAENEAALVTGDKMVHIANHSNYKVIQYWSTTDKASLWDVTVVPEIVVTHEQYDAAVAAAASLPYAIQQAYGLVTAGENIEVVVNHPSGGDSQPSSNLFDGNTSTYVHSSYDAGTMNTVDYHYIQANIGEDVDQYYIYMTPRNANNRPKEIVVSGSNAKDGEYTEIATITTTLASSDVYLSEKLGTEGTDYQYIRLTVKSTNTSTKFFTLSELYFFPANNDVNSLIEAYNAFSSSSITSNEMATAVGALVNAGSKLALSNIKKEISAILTANESNHAETPQLGQYTSEGYNALQDAYNAQDATQESLENAITTFKASLNRPVYFITSAFDGGYPDGSAILYNGSQWRWATANIYNKQMWMTIPGYTQPDVPVVDAYAADGTNYEICDYLTGKVMRDKKVQIVKIADWDGAYNLQYNSEANSTDAAQHAQSGGALVNWKAATKTANQASAWHVEYIGTSYELGQLTDEYFNNASALSTLLSTYETNCAIADGVNNYHETAPGAYADAKSKIAEVLGKLSTPEEIAAAKAQLEASLAINLPENGKFYRLRCTGNGMKYLQCTQNTNADRFDMISGSNGPGTTVNATFCYTNGGLVAYANPMYINHGGNVASYKMSKTDVIFSEATNVKGQYFIKVGDRYLFGDGDTSDSGSGTDSRAGYRWWLEPVETLPVTITSAGYATFFAPVAVEIPEDVEAYYTEEVGDNAVVLTAIEGGVIPANTGVILKGEANTYNFNITADAAAVAGNKLAGTCAAEYVSEDAYVLSKVDGVVGMYKALKNQEEGASWLNNGFKAYLPATAGGEARFLVFDFGTETGIESIEGENGNVKAEIYDLSGRRVQNAQKGLYIVNGKKVVR